ncbi:MAG TPA: TetR/AcrR family transcriptional regulator [Mycobacteriales bacterium]|jgi:AcrR family transcriptional regulator|nr:TetR/AcrR family transcriptional regulator [Mycobacteriales bacterium]
MPPTSVTRQTADQRRETVLRAAIEEFAHGGLNGTSTQAIAARAGISQPYLFRLFPNKKALFIAVLQDAYRQVVERFEAAVGDATGDEALQAMAVSYTELIADRTFLLLALQGFAGCDDEDVQNATRRCFRDVWYAVERLSGADPDTVRMFYATGMLCNVVAAMQLDEVNERWAKLASPSSKSMTPTIDTKN